MKKLVLVILMMFIILPSNALNIVCQDVSPSVNLEENFINKVTGLNFTSRKIVQTIIEKELQDVLTSKIKADLQIFNIQRLKAGEFKSLHLKSDKINYKSFSMTDFDAQTICSYNRVILYNKTKIYYPEELPFAFNAVITNEDIQNALLNDDFKKYLDKNPIKINGKPLLKVYNPQAEIKHGKIYFVVPVKAPIFSLKLRFNADVKVNNNNLVLSDISVAPLDNIINMNILGALTDKINPLQYQINSFNGKYCKIYITNAKISDNIINVEGIFVINKNYTVQNE